MEHFSRQTIKHDDVLYVPKERGTVKEDFCGFGSSEGALKWQTVRLARLITGKLMMLLRKSCCNDSFYHAKIRPYYKTSGLREEFGLLKSN